MLPILFQSPDLTLYSYPLMMGLGWGIAYQIFFGLVPADVPRRYTQLLFWGIFIFAWLGSKVLFLFTVPEEINRDLLMAASFWLGGGFVFYGGLIGAQIFLILFRSFGLPLNLSILWPMLPALTFGHGVGRLGCFLAGCCFGEPTEWWWGVPMHGFHRHPTQLLEAVGLLILGTYILRSRLSKMVMVIHYLLAYGALRLVTEALRGDLIRGQWGPLTPSQWISLLLIFSGAILTVKHYKSRYLPDTEP